MPDLIKTDGALDDLYDIERRIHECFWLLATGVLEIHDRELYKALGFKTFLEYAKERLDFEKSRAYQILDCGRFFEAAGDSTIGGKITHERQIRPVLGMRPASQVKCLEIAAKTAEKYGGAITGKLVESIARDKFGWKSRKEYLDEKKAKNRTPEDDRQDFLKDFEKAVERLVSLGLPADLVERFGETDFWPRWKELRQWVKDLSEE